MHARAVNRVVAPAHGSTSAESDGAGLPESGGGSAARAAMCSAFRYGQLPFFVRKLQQDLMHKTKHQSAVLPTGAPNYSGIVVRLKVFVANLVTDRGNFDVQT